MTDRQNTQGTPFDMAACKTMMEQMMAQMGARCECAEMMSQMTGWAERGCCDWSEMMSRMTAICCGPQNETKSEPTAKATEQA